MRTRGTLVSIAAAAVIALAAVVFLSNSPVSEPRTALAGPCAADPLLFFSNDAEGPPLQGIDLFGTAGGGYSDSMDVVTDPEILPDDKPPVTIEIFGNPGHQDITNAFNPASSEDGSFTTDFLTVIGPDVPPGAYDYTIEITCHTEETTTLPYTVYVDACPAPLSLGSRISGINGTPTPEPRPDECEEPSPTPTAPASTGTPTPTMSPTPTAPPGLQTHFGDVNCSGDVGSSPASANTGVDPVDSLIVLRGDAQLPTDTGECPEMGANTNVRASAPSGTGIQGDGLNLPWGDVDCNVEMTPVDSLKILRSDAGLGVSQEDVCFDIGSVVIVTEL